MTFQIASGVVYNLSYRLVARTGALAQGVKVGLNFPAQVTASFHVRQPATIAGGTTGVINDGFIASNGATITFTTAPTANADFPILIDGTLLCSGSGIAVIFVGSELTATGSGIQIQRGSNAICWQIASGLSV